MKRESLLKKLDVQVSVFYILYLFVVVSLGLLVIEYVSMKINQKDGISLPYLFNTHTGEKVLTTVDRNRQYRTLDPILGYTLDTDESGDDYTVKHPHFFLPGFAVYSNAKNLTHDDYILVVLGGSTTDPMILPYSWPEELAKILEANNIKATVVNGGCGGYSSSQEVFKLIRDVLELAPDIVISYDGVNDRDDWSELPNPMIHTYQKRMMSYLVSNQISGNFLFLPNTIYLLKYRAKLRAAMVRDVSFGVNTNKNSGQFLVRNIDIMRMITAGFGIKYVGFLQPILGIGAYKEASPIAYRKVKKLTETYAVAKQATAKRDYYVDLTDVFIGSHAQPVYTDGVHLTLEGNKIIAKTIFKELKNRNLLPLKRTSGNTN